ncbi:MAG: ribulose-phosphate 3-epimerase [Clostridia bacterium]|nr:ribulose-phosphate 3-epimerase [Clostridia bacterium]
MRRGYIAPSLMCVDLMNAQRDIARLEQVGVDWLHIDVMDNHFVPNITLSTDFARAVKGITHVPLDVHLMVEDPARISIPQLSFLGEADMVSVHLEAALHPLRAIAAIRQIGCKAGIAINPATPLCMLEEVLDAVDMVLIMTVNPGFAGQKLIPATLGKIARLREMLAKMGRDEVLIEVDGNVSFENAEKMHAAGADIYVAGSSSVFAPGATLEANVARFREIVGG